VSEASKVTSALADSEKAITIQRMIVELRRSASCRQPGAGAKVLLHRLEDAASSTPAAESTNGMENRDASLSS
jgi:hypothetical protein